MILRALKLSLLTILLAAAVPTAASATDYCVGVTAPVCPVQTFPATTTGIGQAVSAANTNAGLDRIFVASGNYDANGGIFGNFTGPVQVIGAGRGATTFFGSNNFYYLQLNFQTADSSASGFTVRIDGSPAGAGGASVGVGTIEDVEVIDATAGAGTNLRGISLVNDGKAKNVDISMTGAGVGVVMQGGHATLEDSTVTGSGAGYGINISGNANFAVRNSTFRNWNTAIFMDGGILTATDSVFDLGITSNAVGISAYNGNMGTMPLTPTLKRNTIIGFGDNQKAITFGADSPAEIFTGDFEDLLLYVTGTGARSLNCIQGGSGTVTYAVVHSAFAFTKDFYTGTCAELTAGNIDLADAANTPEFVDTVTGDYRPAANSPLIDRGSEGTGLESALDRAGQPRLADGDKNCIAKIDPGAYEFQPLDPLPNCQPPAPPTEPGTNDPPVATAKITSRAKKSFKRGRRGFSAAKRGAPSFTVTFANSAKAMFTMQSITKTKKPKLLFGAQTLSVKNGAAKFTFGGKFGGRKLAAGSYRVTITPYSSGGTAGKPVTTSIKLK